MSALPQAVSNAPSIPRPVLSSVANDMPLTRVSLAFVERRINLYLRFGHPVRELRLDRWRRCAVFLPAAMFCRVRWESNDYGTTRWQLMILQACTPLDVVQRIAGIQPGARLLLCAEGERQVQSVLPQIDAIEALGINPAAVSPAYWRTLGNRLSARLPLPAYTVERHAAYLTGEVLR
ncbi:MAG: transposase [Hydrogenophilales bacterium 17-61-9]|nr:MAG: transposase [Hydrogenophilales bacterium 17-61-9]